MLEFPGIPWPWRARSRQIFDIRPDVLPLVPGGLFIYGDATLSSRRDGHGGQRVMVTGDAARLPEERDIGPL